MASMASTINNKIEIFHLHIPVTIASKTMHVASNLNIFAGKKKFVSHEMRRKKK